MTARVHDLDSAVNEPSLGTITFVMVVSYLIVMPVSWASFGLFYWFVFGEGLISPLTLSILPTYVVALAFVCSIEFVAQARFKGSVLSRPVMAIAVGVLVNVPIQIIQYSMPSYQRYDQIAQAMGDEMRNLVALSAEMSAATMATVIGFAAFVMIRNYFEQRGRVY